MAMARAEQKICESNLIAAYVDGELEARVAVLLEEHLESCASCRAELRSHRLFVCELDAALNDSGEISVPSDFSRRVAARAASDMSGLRSGSENKKALSICLILALAGFALLGTTARDSVFLIVREFIAKAFGVISFLATAIYDAATGLIVILRVLSREIVVEAGSFGVVVVLLAFAVLVLTRLISNYHRSGATE